MSTKEELVMLYEFTGSRISEFKSQQWAITNYGSVLFTSIVSSKKLIGNISCTETIALNMVAFIILLCGTLLINQFSKSISERQICLSNIRAKFGDEFIEVWGGPKKNIQPKTVLKRLHILILFTGFVLTSFLLWRV